MSVVKFYSRLDFERQRYLFKVPESYKLCPIFLKSGETIYVPYGNNDKLVKRSIKALDGAINNERVPFIRVINLAGGCQ